MEEQLKKDVSEYDKEPVRYCPRCYSLLIGSIDGIDNSDYCMNCGSSDIGETTIDKWEQLYKKRYGHDFVNRKQDTRASYISRMSISELKSELCDRKNWKVIIKTLYSGFPDYLNKIESVLVVFDRLIKDGRLDELKTLLINK